MPPMAVHAACWVGAYRVAGKLPATYEVVYGHAWRAEDKLVLADGVAPIAFRTRTK